MSNKTEQQIRGKRSTTSTSASNKKNKTNKGKKKKQNNSEIWPSQQVDYIRPDSRHLVS